MKTAIFQPTYLSWLGFYKAIQWSDKFVFLDDVQFENHSWQSRNRIKSAAGELMLSVPIVRNWPQLVREVRISYNQDWIGKHLRSIETCYGRAPFFRDFYPVLKNCFQRKPERLIDLNVDLIRSICGYLGLKGDFIYASDLGLSGLARNERIIAILKRLGAGTYLHSVGAAEYMHPALPAYRQAGLKLVVLDFPHPVYPQLFGDFICHLSIIDAIFNCGPSKVKAMLDLIVLKEKNYG